MKDAEYGHGVVMEMWAVLVHVVFVGLVWYMYIVWIV